MLILTMLGLTWGAVAIARAYDRAEGYETLGEAVERLLGGVS